MDIKGTAVNNFKTVSSSATVKITQVPTKSLLISLPYKSEPNYVFEGVWVGSDIRTILKTITRAYRVQQRTSRRANLPTLATTGATNG